MGIFGWDLPPGCSMRDIERACGSDLPDTCPVCGGEWCDEDGNLLVPFGQEPFCSVACADKYRSDSKAADDLYAKALEEEDRSRAEAARERNPGNAPC